MLNSAVSFERLRSREAGLAEWAVDAAGFVLRLDLEGTWVQTSEVFCCIASGSVRS